MIQISMGWFVDYAVAQWLKALWVLLVYQEEVRPEVAIFFIIIYIHNDEKNHYFSSKMHFAYMSHVLADKDPCS